jgi:very-short-patch-repair endonuclease
MDSVFEEQVMAALKERGYQVHPQVGIAGFFIDLAVADEQIPGRYILGIECDGAAYHDSRSARDRDRLRQAVLEDHGWNIYRIWSADWFQRPKAELERLVAAIERAKADVRSGTEEHLSRRAVPVEVVTIERADVTEIGLQPVIVDEISSATLYQEAVLRPNIVGELHEAPIGVVIALVKQTVGAEGPVHQDEVVTRIRSAWGLQRAGNRIDAHVGAAITIAQNSQEIVRDGEFLLWPDKDITLRDRSGVTSLSLRRIEMLPPMEIDEGLITVIRTSLGATVDQAVNAVARGLGFKSTSSQLKELVESRIVLLQEKGSLIDFGGMLTVLNQT